MALTLKILDTTNEKSWDSLVAGSSHGTLFHTLPWLRIAAAQSRSEFIPCMFYRGTQLAGIYPVFIKNHGLVKMAFSPPSFTYMLYLGPVIADYDSLKQDKKESTFIEIQKELDSFIFNTLNCKYARIRSAPGILDSRPLRWSGYTIDPYYTYRVKLDGGIDHVWEQFDRKLRVEINKTVREGVTVREGNETDLEFIHDTLYDRYRQQRIRPTDYLEYLKSLFRVFYPENIKIFVAEYRGRKIGGTINLCYKDIMYLWVGIPKSDLPGISPNALIQWEAMKWAYAHGYKVYEEMDAGDDPRLRYFKSKFNPDLAIWYSAAKYSSFVYRAGEHVFKLLKK